jgi:hypothetical protein
VRHLGFVLQVTRYLLAIGDGFGVGEGKVEERLEVVVLLGRCCRLDDLVEVQVAQAGGRLNLVEGRCGVIE